MQAPAHPGTSPLAQRLVVLLFSGFLAAPAVDMLVRPASARGPEIEGRLAQPFPDWRMDVPDLSFPQKFEPAFADALGLRDVLLRWHSWSRLELLGVTPAPVLLGKEDWMFYTFGKSLENWRGLFPLDHDGLVLWQRNIESRRDYARAHGAEYVIVFGPNKESIYPDFLPEGYEPLGPTRLDQLTEWMAAHSDVTLIDLRPCLRAARSEDTPQHHLYYEEGSHWHGRGCITASREILRRITEHFPAMAKRPESPWQVQSIWPAERWRSKMYLEAPRSRLSDWAKLPDESSRARHLGDDYWARVQRYEQRVPAPELPRAVMFHDSFGTTLEPLLAEQFARLTSVFDSEFDEQLIADERPAIVIDLYVERMLSDGLLMTPRN